MVSETGWLKQSKAETANHFEDRTAYLGGLDTYVRWYLSISSKSLYKSTSSAR